MSRSWTDFVTGKQAGHAVQVYGELDELAESVAAYLAAGFARGEPGVVVGTREHVSRFAGALAERGWDEARVQADRMLVVADAESTLSSFMHDGMPAATAFESVVGGLIDTVSTRSPGKQVRAFGEMVDLLSRRGEIDAAVALEELWNDLARRRNFSLLCGYRMDVFDRATQLEAMPDVCRVHSHVLPVPDADRLSRAVDHALEEVLGPEDAGKVYLMVGQRVREERVPVAQLVLMWVSANMPGLADRILASARTHYAVAAAA